MIYARTMVQERRRKITTLLVRGLSPGEIAQVLGVSPETVYNDIRTIRSGRNEDLVAHSRKEMLAQLLLNARERTRELWDIVEGAESDYVKLLALRELRIHDQNVLKHLVVLSNALKQGGRLRLIEHLRRRFAAEPEDAAEVTESSGNATPEVATCRGGGGSLAASPATRKSPGSATPEVAQRPLTVVENTVAEPDSVHEGEEETFSAQPEATQVTPDPLCESVKICRKSLAGKEVNLQTADSKVAPAGGKSA